jgi:hypothetical protein
LCNNLLRNDPHCGLQKENRHALLQSGRTDTLRGQPDGSQPCFDELSPKFPAANPAVPISETHPANLEYRKLLRRTQMLTEINGITERTWDEDLAAQRQKGIETSAQGAFILEKPSVPRHNPLFNHKA